MRRGTNLPRMGDYNQMVVLDQIRRSESGVSRIELATNTGLSVQTISNLVNRLRERGLITEGEKRIAGRGKPRTMLHLAPRGGYAVGVHIDPVVITSVLIDLTGDTVAESKIATPHGPSAAISAMAAQLDQLLAQADVSRALVLGLGVAAPGPVDFASGAVVRPPLLEGWVEVSLRSELAAATGLPVILEKDVSAAMIAELWRGNRMLRGTSLFVYLGFGVAVATAHHGELLAGSFRNAGEVGHLLVDATGPQCWCGRRGCFGVGVAPGTLVNDAVVAEVLSAHIPRETPSDVDAALNLVCEAALQGNQPAQRILGQAAHRAARAVTIIADLVDADVVVFGGPNWPRLAPYCVPVVEAELQAHATMRDMHPVEVLGSAVGELVGAVGAAALVLDDLFTPRTSGLVVAAASDR